MRKTTLLLLSVTLMTLAANAKPDKPKKENKKDPLPLEEVVVEAVNPITAYQAAKTRIFDLVHTKLHVRPVASEKRVYGQAELYLKPYFYPQNTLVLDAKGMFIKRLQLKVGEGWKDLPYTYDSLQLTITLDKTYTRDEEFVVAIDYVARPYELDSAMSIYGRGVYFIDADDHNPYKPYHFWSQSEEEAGSLWFPTIDATNERCTQEIYLTVDSAYLSLSNGILVESKNNPDGTRTDHWLQDKPHAPYLFFISGGPYQKYTTAWRDKEVSYYTFPKYFSQVDEVFRYTPDILELYSQKLGVDFPWDKLANIVAWDYTAGAMENSSAIIYYDPLFCRENDLVDNNFEYIIAHEAFHQWFGDYVTCESWANVSLNESMADYGEVIWFEHHYGKDFADAYNHESLGKYLRYAMSYDDPIFNYYYETAHDLFDPIRYEKGGRVLHLLRNHVGDEAFFAALKKYLTGNAYNSVELDNLRLAFEAVSGEDLNWFFNQWFLNPGHPVLDIQSDYNEINHTVELRVSQQQPRDQAPVYRLPTKVDIYFDDHKETHEINIIDREQAFYFPAKTRPRLVNFDADKVIPCEKTETHQPEENIYKFQHAPLYVDKREAIDALSGHLKNNESAQEVYYQAMEAPNWYLRKFVLEQTKPADFSDKNRLSMALQKIRKTDPNAYVRHKALQLLFQLEPARIESLCLDVIDTDSSNICLAAAFDKLAPLNPREAYTLALKFSDTENAILMQSLVKIFADSSADNLAFIKKAIWLNTYRSYLSNFKSIKSYLRKCSDPLFSDGVRFLADLNQYEENDLNVKASAKVLQDLLAIYQVQAEDKKLSVEERERAAKRLAELTPLCANLRSRSVEYHH